MKLHHIAFWTHDIERLSQFYQMHFNAELAFKHTEDDFSCVFLSAFGGKYLEIMTRPNLPKAHEKNRVGHSHISIEVESKKEVDRLTQYFTELNVPLEKIQEQYDDGFYETSIFDPDGNIIEIAYIDRNVNNTV